MVNDTIQRKDNAIKLSDQVQEILLKIGFSFAFNWNDYNRYKNLHKKAFNKAHDIAEQFVIDAETPGDYQEYIF